MFSKMTSQMTTIYTPFADGRTVRDIVEHSPALVNETWCRDLLRHLLDSLERQYATGAPHRPISPDTIVMLANNEPLLLPAPEEVGPAGTATLAADLHALALVVHYAITAEMPPDGPLGPRLYDDYNTVLTNGLDRCLGPNQRLRPKTVADMRSLLGIEAPADDQPAHASTLAPAAMPAPSHDLAEAEPAALDGAAAGSFADAPQPVPATTPEFTEPAAAQAVQATESPVARDYSQPLPTPAVPEARPAEPQPEPGPRLHTPSTTAIPAAASAAAPAGKRSELPPAATAAEPLLRTPAAAVTGAPAAAAPRAGAAAAKQPTTLEAATAARLQEEAARKRAAAAPRTSNVQRWGWIAGAAIVLLAAGSALVSWLDQQDADDMAALSLPPAQRAASGLGPGETVVVPRAEGSAAAVQGEAPAAEAGAALPPGETPDAAEAVPVPGHAAEPVVNGVTYKLLIKPWGTVYVDDIDRGVSPPVKRLTLSRGKHTIRIVNPNFPDHVLAIDAGKRGSATIEHDFTAKAE